jgi:hypothetical protein
MTRRKKRAEDKKAVQGKEENSTKFQFWVIQSER